MNWSSVLRTELSRLAEEYAKQSPEPIEFYRSLAKTTAPVILFPGGSEDGRHGNFHPDSYRNIRKHKDWRERLRKPHPQKGHLPKECREYAKELDSCNSSDAKSNPVNPALKLPE